MAKKRTKKNLEERAKSDSNLAYGIKREIYWLFMEK